MILAEPSHYFPRISTFLRAATFSSILSHRRIHGSPVPDEQRIALVPPFDRVRSDKGNT